MICLAASLKHKKTPSRFTAVTLRQDSRDVSTNGVPVPARPALANNPSSLPKSFTVEARVAMTFSSLLTSQT